MILEVDNLQIHYSTRDGTARAVDGASFVVPEGRIVGLVGESGCGKTTAVRAIMAASSSRARRWTRRRPAGCAGATSPTCRKAP
jgi:peptide/nickel transport system ATP-binding protein